MKRDDWSLADGLDINVVVDVTVGPLTRDAIAAGRLPAQLSAETYAIIGDLVQRSVECQVFGRPVTRKPKAVRKTSASGRT